MFLQAPNPLGQGWTSGQGPSAYLLWQRPAVLLDRGLHAALFSRFLVRDCGPVTCGLLIVGAFALRRSEWRRRARSCGLLGWSLMGILFWLLLAPKLIDHDYYELMLLPAAAILAAFGLGALAERWRRHPPARLVQPTVLVAALIVQSPWVSGGMFHLERGKIELGRALASACPPGKRIVAMGPGIALIVPLHYSQREGWTIRAPVLPADWSDQLDHWRSLGAECIGLYFDAKATRAARESFDPLIDALEVIDHGKGRPARHGKPARYEFVVLRLPEGLPERIARDGRRSASPR
jgi:hypothetical protein